MKSCSEFVWRAAGFVISASLFFVVGCAQEVSSKPPPPAAVKVTVAKPLVMPIVEWDQYTGRLDAIDSVEVRARVSGYLESTHFNEGQMVQSGDLLAIIDQRPFKAEHNAAKARLEEASAKLAEANSLYKQAIAEKSDVNAQLTLADRRLDRVKRLFARKAVTKEEIDVTESEQLQATAAIEAANAKIESAKAGIATAKAAIETAKANIESAVLNLKYTQIRAPITGRISRRYVTEGNLISGGTSLSTLITTIVSIKPIHCYFDANEHDFLKYVRLARQGKRASSREVKNPVYVALVDEQGYPHNGHMDFVDNRIDINTGTMRGRAILANEDELLTPGLFVKLRLPGSGRYDAVLIPDSAIGSDQSEKFVYVIDKQGLVNRRVITTGPISHGLRIIRSGLNGSELIVTHGLQRIYPGITVETSNETIEPASSDLPDNYVPVPKEKWLSRTMAKIPKGIEANAERYRLPQSGTNTKVEKE